MDDCQGLGAEGEADFLQGKQVSSLALALADVGTMQSGVYMLTHWTDSWDHQGLAAYPVAFNGDPEIS